MTNKILLQVLGRALSKIDQEVYDDQEQQLHKSAATKTMILSIFMLAQTTLWVLDET